MGSGKPRSNIELVSAGLQLVTEDGAGIQGCVIDEQVPANVDGGVGVADRVGQVELAEDGTLWLVIGSHPVAHLIAGEIADRLVGCMRRGHRFVGTVVGPRAVRVQNER